MFGDRLNSKMGGWMICLTIVAFGTAYRLFSAGGDLQMNTVHPSEGNVWSAALSPDGTQVAMMRREGLAGTGTSLHEAIEIRDVHSDKEVAAFSLPPRNWQSARQSYVDRPLRYCDDGKYLLAFAGPDALMAVNTSKLTINTVITLGTPPVQTDHQVHWTTFQPLTDRPGVDCAMHTPYVLLGTWNPLASLAPHSSSIKVFDLDTGAEIANLSPAIGGGFQGGGIAISPDGSRVAVVTWSQQQHGYQVEVIDVHRASRLSTLLLGRKTGSGLYPTYSVAFGGNDSVLVGEKVCEDGDTFCDFNLHRRVIRDWNFSQGREAKEFGRLGAEVYRYFSASADGRVAFAYTGLESYCKSCNDGIGETKISAAKFLIWDRASGRMVAESPMLDVERHSCLLAIGLGSCTAYERVPELQLSDDGKSVLVLMPLTSDDPPDRKPRQLLVFRRP